ncbi:MAG: hypothetical protein WHS46_12035 [Desulfosoma sp.]
MADPKEQKSSKSKISKESLSTPKKTLSSKETLEVVIKADTVGTCEAIEKALENLTAKGHSIRIIHRGVGTVSKSDILMAATGSRLVLALGVDLGPKVAAIARDMGVEIFLFDVIHDLVDAVTARIFQTRQVQSQTAEPEKILGQGKIIALFKSSRHGIIIGCEITEGIFRLGAPFRIFSAMGPVYAGVIQSMQIDRNPVKEAGKGKQVGIKIPDWKEAHLGDLVEVYEKS